MGFIVVQWENENSVKRKWKESRWRREVIRWDNSWDIDWYEQESSGLYKATILKVCGE